MKPRYKLLITDVDGTLMSGVAEIPRENITAIAEARHAGIYVSLSTGRSIASCRKIIKQLGLQDNYHMFYDGAVITRVYDDQPIHGSCFDTSVVQEMVAFADERGIDLELATVKALYMERETWITKIKGEFFSNETIIGSLEGLWERDGIIRACLCTRDGDDETQVASFVERFGPRVQYTEAHSLQFPEVKFINMVAPGQSKGTAMNALISHLGYTADEVMAVGDWLNDVAMIKNAGLGVAMGNAHEDVKKAADHITLHVDEHGLAEAVRKFLLS